jgi:hypothetical protein
MSETNPYKPPEIAERLVGVSRRQWFWLWSTISVVASSLSLVLFYLYGHWHWHRGPWAETLPGQLGLSWLVAVDGSKACSALLALVSLVITVVLFRKKAYLQGAVTVPTCFLSMLTVGAVT